MSEWISVNERMPEIIKDSSENVLIFCDEGILVACINFYPAKGHRKNDEYIWSEQSTGCGCCASTIEPTHWMPLPPTPEK